MPALDGMMLRLSGGGGGGGVALRDQAGRALRFTPLLRAMMAFHATLLEARSRLRTEMPSAEAPPEVQQARIGRIAAELEAVLQAQRDQARRQSDRQAALLRDAQYVMCALADDLLLYDEACECRLLWREELLESRIFGTRIAGERFFDRAERIAGLADRDGADLAPVYLLALCLGFRGRYRGAEDSVLLRQQARALFEAAVGRSPDARMDSGPLAPLAVAGVRSGEASLRRGRGFGWPGMAAGLLGLFVAASTALWFWQTRIIWQAAETVFKAAQ